MADFDKGTIKRLSLSSDGRLALAPAVKELADPNVTFLWAVARDSKGNVYAGTSDGRLICLKTGNKDADGWYAWGGNAQHNKVQ